MPAGNTSTKMDSEMTITYQEPHVLLNHVKIPSHFSAMIAKGEIGRYKLKLHRTVILKAAKVIRCMEGLPQEGQLKKPRDLR